MRSLMKWHVFLASVVLCASTCYAWESSEAVPQWIWHTQHQAGHVPETSCFFRRQVRVPKAKKVSLAVAADDHYIVFVNGKKIGGGTSSQGVATFDVTRNFNPGDNMIAIRVDNQEGATAGLVARIVVIDTRDQTRVVTTDASWKTSLSSGLFWTRPAFADGRWQAAKQLGPLANFVALQRATTARALAQQKQQAAKQQNAAQQQQKQQLAKQQEQRQQQIENIQEKRRQQQLAELQEQQRLQAIQQQQAASIVPVDPTPAAAPQPSPDKAAQQTINVTRAIPDAPLLSPPPPRPDPASTPAAKIAPVVKAESLKAKVVPTQMALTRKPTSDGLEVPREFKLQQLAGHADLGSLAALTFDERGRLIAAREDGQLWLLLDNDQDGTVETRQDLGQLTKSCQGMLAHDGDLFVSGDGTDGMAVYRLSDRNNDGVLDHAKAVVTFRGENLEHGPHGLTLGPDGMIYVMVGNHSPLATKSQQGPYRHVYEGDLVQPRFEDPGGHANGVAAPGGYVMRMDPTGKDVQVVAGGLRNAYDLAFNHHGELFAHDSDMESDRGTTWYRPTRLYHVIDGSEFGWRSGWSKWPEYFLDALPGIGDTGRGSPTGMVVYDHHAFPPAYHNTVFSADWSNGQVYVIPLRPKGASFEADPKPFLRGTPLNVTDIEVGPDGALYLVTGGRGTAGNVYRVSWKGRDDAAATPEGVASNIDEVVRQPQMHSSWARARIAQQKAKMGSKWNLSLQQVARDVTRPTAERVQALQVMQWFSPPPTIPLLGELAHDEHVVVRRMATYLLGLRTQSAAAEILVDQLDDPDAIVRRRACEALVRGEQDIEPSQITTLLTSADRFESWSARLLLETAPFAEWRQALLTTEEQREFLMGAVGALCANPNGELARAIIDRSVFFMQGFLTDQDFVDLLRVQQLALIRGKLAADDVPQLHEWLPDEYPSSSERINRELIRLLIFLQSDSINDRYVRQLGEEHASEEAIHLAMHVTFLKSNWTTEQKLKVFEYLTTPPNAGNSLPGYLQNAAHQFGELLTEEELMMAMARGPENPGSALAALLRMPVELDESQLEAIKQLDQDLIEQEGDSFRRLKVAIVAVLARDGEPPSTEYLRTIYDRDPYRRVEVALGMAQTTDIDNWSYLVRSLPILESDDAKEMLTSLKQFRKWPNDAEAYRQVIMVAERLEEKGAPEAIALLEHWQGYAPSNGQVTWQDGISAWKRWYQSTYPDEPVPEMIVSTRNSKWDANSLLRHLDRSEREQSGSAAHGMQVFIKAQCVDCHRVSNFGESMGPDLSGVNKRFLKREVLDSILYPSKAISDQYAAKIVSTIEGKSYIGIVADGAGGETVILQANGQKVRVPEAEIDEIEPSRLSAMPEGLLDELSLEEITDLFAFLLSDPDRIAALRDKADAR